VDFGYARVSTPDQNLDHQLDILARQGIDRENVYVDVSSGSRAARPELDRLVRILRPGDVLHVTRLDRLSRSVLHLVTLGAELREREIDLVVTEQGLTTRTPEGRAMFHMLAVLAELQRELILANTRDGLAAARARGKVGGRKPRLTPKQAELAQRLYNEQPPRPVREIAEIIGVPRSTLYGYLTPDSALPSDSREGH